MFAPKSFSFFVISICLSLIFLISPTTSFSHSKKDHGHKHNHGAHVHGEGNVNIVFEGNKLNLEWTMPGDTVVGFEHEPRNDRQTKRLEEAKEKLQDFNNLVNIVDGKCSLKNNTLEIDYEGGHSEFKLSSQLECEGTISAFQFEIFKNFNRLKKLRVIYVSPTANRSEDLTSRRSELKL